MRKLWKTLTSPIPEIWQIYFEKWLTFTVSFKYHIFITATSLLLFGYIDGSEWIAAVTILAGLKEGIKALRAWKTKKQPDSN